jgi:hypothetical protein
MRVIMIIQAESFEDTDFQRVHFLYLRNVEAGYELF